jgi:hypothetical protein
MEFAEKVKSLEGIGMVSAEVDKKQIKIPTKLYRIGEIVRCTPYSRQTIHNYTIMGLIREAEWTEGGHRMYNEGVFAKLSMIMELKKTKTLEEIKRILKEYDGQLAGSVSAAGN